MSLAQRFERRLESLVGTAFARVFKGQVEPVEVGNALTREATDKRRVMGNAEVLAPNRYRVTLSAGDYDRYLQWQSQLCNSLAEMVQDYLDENGWRTFGDVVVLLARDESLHTGVFGVASRMESDAPPRRRPVDSLSVPPDLVNPVQAPEPAPSYTPPPSYIPPPVAPAYTPPPAPPAYTPPPTYTPPPAYVPPPQRASIVVDGTSRRFDLKDGQTVVGRGHDADVQLLDQGVSRRHIEIGYDGHTAVVADLNSTNGTTVNGHVVTTQQLRHGDVIRIGHTRLVFQQEQG